LIGARVSSVFLSNCTVWVEGITDRLYLRKYLQVFQDSLDAGSRPYREDYHFSFVEYGGNNITHWSFLDEETTEKTIDVDKLCAKLFLITDRDGTGEELDDDSKVEKSKKRKRHIALKKKLDKQYYCLKCREIENLLSREVLKKTIMARAKGSPIFSSEFETGDYTATPLGTFINKTVKNAGRVYPEGTLTKKVDFCNAALLQINNIGDLSVEARLIARKLYDFIEAHNS